MELNNYEQTLRLFPHWYDKNPYSNFSKTVRVLNNQYLDKYHKIKTLDWSRRLSKPLQMHKIQNSNYEYDMVFEAYIENIKQVNVYVNPVVNDNEDILWYEKCFTKNYKDDKTNNHFYWTYHGDTRKEWKTHAQSYINNISYDDYQEIINYDTVEEKNITFDAETLEDYNLEPYTIVEELPLISKENKGNIYFLETGDNQYDAYTVSKTNISGLEELGLTIDDADEYTVDVNETLYQLIPPSFMGFDKELDDEFSLSWITWADWEGSITFDNLTFAKIDEDTWVLDGDYGDLFIIPSNEEHVWELSVQKGDGYSAIVLKCDDMQLYTTQNLSENMPHRLVELYVDNGMLANLTYKTIRTDYYVYEQLFKDIPCNVETNTHNITTFEIPIIPKDTFVMEVLTYDDYRWVKGFPENDDTSLYRIYKERKSYTDYLVFQIDKKNIKEISILKDNKTLFHQDFFIKKEDANIIYHDYQLSKNQKQTNDNITIDSDDDKYYIKTILKDTDYIELIDYSSLPLQYPNTQDYIISSTPITPSEDTLHTVTITKEYGEWNAYETIQDEQGYRFVQLLKNLKAVKTIKPYFDLNITIYDPNHKNCREYDKTIQKRYNGQDKTNYDCFSHDFSLDMLGKWWNIPRLEFQPSEYNTNCEKKNIEYYKKTYPPYNDRLTEDDYHYQKRIKTYISKYNKEHFPVLEIWKNYQIWGTLRNRKDILSVQGKSYLHDYPYYEDTLIREEENNKLEVTQGIGNPITIDNHTWHETILAGNLPFVPNSEYVFRGVVNFTETLADERVTLHIYYLDKTGNCINEQATTPNMTLIETEDSELHSYSMELSFTTNKEARKMDIVFESDIQYSLNNCSLRKVTIADKDAMYMTTKKDYNSCVYELSVNYNDIPSNVDFSNTLVFNKILQRSLPLTHKGFMNISTDYDETSSVCTNFGDITILNFFDGDNSEGDGDTYRYTKRINRYINKDCHYRLNVTFINKEKSDDNEWIYTYLIFKKQGQADKTITLESMIKPDSEATLNYNFIPDDDYNILDIKFESQNTVFNYKNLSLNREEPIPVDELWQT